MRKQLLLNELREKLVVDLFAGGGGMSTAIEIALGYSPDIALNHDDDALSMHRVNHPQTRHFKADVFEVDPRWATRGRPVGLLHMSPDCTHHSQAAGGQPRDKRSRSLSWVGIRWAGQVRPDIITMENVKQILQWGPLVAKRDKETGRVITLDLVFDPITGKMVNRIADPGERVPVQKQYLIPDKKRLGKTWRRFVSVLNGMGYEIEVFRLPAMHYGAATTRDRVYMVARCDGLPIAAPEQTHFKKPTRKQKKWRVAAECIDWSIPSKSIFGRPKPLAEATMRRIAKGIKRYVLDSADPFIVPIAHYNGSEPVHSTQDPLRTITANPKGGSFAVCSPSIVPVTHQGGDRNKDIQEPLPTITAAHRGELALGAATLVQAGYGEREGQSPRALDPDAPLGTVVAGGIKHAVATAILAGVGGRAGQTKPKPADQPANTITAKGDTALATIKLAPHIMTMRNAGKPFTGANEPTHTITAGGAHQHLVTAHLAQMNGGFNETPGHDAREPLSTVTNSGSQQQLVTAHLAHLRNNCDARNPEDPLQTISAGGEHHGLVTAFLSRQFEKSVGHAADEPHGTITAGGGGKSALVECHLSPAEQEGALRVAAFLMRYYSEGGQWGDVRDPMDTITTRDRLALVTVMIKGTPYVIVDICLRMLEPRELYNAQGFPSTYIIDRGHDGRVFSKSKQVKMVGNSVSPPPAIALLNANCSHLAIHKTGRRRMSA
jgi:DNA (cytosine-5)-methyltransferase 1